MTNDTRRNRVVLALLLVVSFTLITIDFRGGDDSVLDPLRGAAAAVFGPVEELAADVVRPVSSFVEDVADFPEQRERIDELERENDQLRQQLHGAEADRERAEELDRMLGVAGTGRYQVVTAQVIAIGPAQGFSWTATIDVGSRDGISRDMTVINGDGLVGRVTTVGPSTSTVLLAIDPTSSVGARMEGSDEIGIAGGAGPDTIDLELLDPQAAVEEGDRVVTFGSQDSRPYVPGVPVGEVVSVERKAGDLTRSATVRPFVDFTALDLVGVVVEPPREDPRDAVLPPRPTP